MAKMIQVRNVPTKLHGELIRRAKARCQTLTAYIQEILEREVERPSVEDVLRRIHAREPVRSSLPVATLIREEREERERGLVP